MKRVCLGFAQAFAQGFACGLKQILFSYGKKTKDPPEGWGGGPGQRGEVGGAILGLV